MLLLGSKFMNLYEGGPESHLVLLATSNLSSQVEKSDGYEEWHARLQCCNINTVARALLMLRTPWANSKAVLHMLERSANDGMLALPFQASANPAVHMANMAGRYIESMLATLASTRSRPSSS